MKPWIDPDDAPEWTDERATVRRDRLPLGVCLGALLLVASLFWCGVLLAAGQEKLGATLLTTIVALLIALAVCRRAWTLLGWCIIALPWLLVAWTWVLANG